jgi:hypothetical protein
MLPAEMALITYEAKDQNDWEVIAITEFPTTGGLVPHGIVLCKRKEHPFEDSPYCVNSWSRHDNRITFSAGSYDLTRHEARAEFKERM